MAMNNSRRTALLLSGLLLGSCSTSRLVVTPEYAVGKTVGGTLAVIVADTPRIGCTPDVAKALGTGETDTLVWSFFRSQLEKDILRQTSFSRVRFDAYTADGLYSAEHILLGDDTIDVQLPARGMTFHFLSSDPDFVLVIGDIDIGTDVSGDLAAPATLSEDSQDSNGGGSLVKRLFYSTTVALWDNRRGQLATYGVVEARATAWFFPVFRKRHWKSVSRNYVREIFDETSLRKK